MRRALIPLLALAACGEPQSTPRTLVHDGMPPARFRGDVVATQVTFTASVGKACAAAGLQSIADTQTVACEVIGNGRREIIIGNPCKGSGAYARDLCHAVGHLNGWPKDHGS